MMATYEQRIASIWETGQVREACDACDAITEEIEADIAALNDLGAEGDNDAEIARLRRLRGEAIFEYNAHCWSVVR